MSAKFRGATPAQRQKAPLSMETMNRMVALYNSGQWAELEKEAGLATRQHPEHIFGWKALGKALMKAGKPAEAIAPLERATKIAPNDADPHMDLATAYQILGRPEDAELRYRQVLKLTPGSATLHDTLGALLCELARFNEAETEIRRALEIDPLLVQSHINLGFVTATLNRFDEAEASYRRALALSPDFYEVHRRLGDMLSRFESRAAEAIPFLERAIALNPADVGSIVTFGNVLMTLGRHEESQAMFLRARQIQPLITWYAKKPKPDFSVLMLDAPGAGSTPVNYLAGRSHYESNFVGIMPGLQHDIALLRSKAGVVFNMIGDADNGKDVLPLAAQLADQLGRPVLNHPRVIMATDRESIARKLAGIPLVRVAKIARFSTEALVGAGRQEVFRDFIFPLLIRTAGTHGGDDFEKVDDFAGVDTFVANHPGATFYAIEFIDYRSADGYYRKYRVICLNGEALPYHLAIHDHWMVHHFRTDMANQEWMRKEEEAFLANIDGVFDAERQAALRAVGRATGLDYCGIDCALDREGNIVVFESNATMLVHDEKDPLFMYKNPYIAKIKTAFDAMLTQSAAAADSP
jgi:tetratricopeptide (TPR) repeat protein